MMNCSNYLDTSESGTSEFFFSLIQGGGGGGFFMHDDRSNDVAAEAPKELSTGSLL